MDLGAYFDGFVRRDWERDVEGTVRFAAVGLGWWTREQALPALDRADYCEATVVVSGDAEKAARVADRSATVDRALSYDEFHDGAAADAYDAVYIVTPNAFHLDYVESAARRGKAVVCEKPMEATVERAERMVAVVDECEVPLMVAYRMQTEPAVRRARALIRDGVVGDPVSVHGQMSQRLLETIPDPNQWRLDPDLVGPGATVMDIGLYPLNTARFLLDSDPVAVQASLSSHDSSFDDVPDERASFLVDFPDGIHAACTASQNADQSSRITVHGTEGSVTVEPAFYPDQPRQLTLSRGSVVADTAFPQRDQMTEEFDYFAAHLLAGEELAPDGEHGLVDMRAMDAIYEAAETGARVRLD